MVCDRQLHHRQSAYRSTRDNLYYNGTRHHQNSSKNSSDHVIQLIACCVDLLDVSETLRPTRNAWKAKTLI